jgi:glycine oxidase
MEQRYYIIVGQGIAGTVMALTLLEQGCSVRIIDNPSLSGASRVAAGLYNPIVFKRLVKSWKADELIPFMDEFYPGQETLLSTRFYYKKEIIKVFSDAPEKELWIKKGSDDVGRYMEKNIQVDFLTDVLCANQGTAKVFSAGNLDARTFVNASREYFKSKGILLEEAFDYEKLEIGSDHAKYKGTRADKIIFCEGYRAVENPWFSWLPFKLTKGEVLTIRLEGKQIPFDTVINKGVFVLPLGDDLYRVGATYNWKDLSEDPTAEGREELIEKIKELLCIPFEVLAHEAGVRPTVSDRRPLIGLHPTHSCLAVFNGMGTKAVMLAPYFAGAFADHLLREVILDPEADIRRFRK